MTQFGKAVLHGILRSIDHQPLSQYQAGLPNPRVSQHTNTGYIIFTLSS